jgi:hypothetical protein
MQSDMIFAQKVRWGPTDGHPAGIRASDESNNTNSFVPWRDLENELRQQLMPQLFAQPSQFTFTLADYNGKSNWLVTLIDESGEKFCDVWFGINLDNGWAFDGMIHLGDPDAEPRVWQSYQRYSDGTYRRLPSQVSSLDKFTNMTTISSR